MPESAKFITCTDLAKFGISARGVAKAKAAKRLVCRAHKIDVIASLIKVQKSQDPRKPDALLQALRLAAQDAGTPQEELPKASLAEPSDGVTQIESEDRAEASRRLEWAKAKKAELEFDELKGELVRATEVRLAWSSLVTSFRSSLLLLPARLAPRISVIADTRACQQLLDAEIKACMVELANYSPGGDKDED